MVDPTNVFAMDDIKFMTGFNIEPVVASETAILEGIDKAYNTAPEEDLESVMASMGEEGADVEVQAEELENRCCRPGKGCGRSADRQACKHDPD